MGLPMRTRSEIVRGLLDRVDEVVGERDRARELAARLEEDNARTIDTLVAIRAIHQPADNPRHCVECVFPWPCATRQLVDETLTSIGWEDVH